MISIEVITQYASFTGALGKKLYGNTRWSLKRAREKVQAELDDSPHVRRENTQDGDDLIPGSRCLGFLVGPGVTWNQFRSSKVHEQNLRTLVMESLAAGWGIPTNCQRMVAATASRTERAIYALVDSLIKRLEQEGVQIV